MKLIECPRDAMQGINEWIPTELKISFINTLLSVGFDTLDFGSFVSFKAIPQFKDIHDIMSAINYTTTKTSLLAIIANIRGTEDACKYPCIKYLGFPLSISETFQLRNTNKTISESLEQLNIIKKICDDAGKQLVIYLSMAFGNPYGDDYNTSLIIHYTQLLSQMGISIISLADTIGCASPSLIQEVYGNITPTFPDIEWGAHFHTTPATAFDKIVTAYKAGCRRFDGALGGYGGCPYASDSLVGNIPTEKLIDYYLSQEDNTLQLDLPNLIKSKEISNFIFTKYK